MKKQQSRVSGPCVRRFRRMSRRPACSSTLLLAALLVAILAPAALGTTRYWDSGGNGWQWADRFNWSGDTLPDGAVYIGDSTYVLDANVTLDYSTTVGAVHLSQNANADDILTISGNGALNSTSSLQMAENTSGTAVMYVQGGPNYFDWMHVGDSGAGTVHHSAGLLYIRNSTNDCVRLGDENDGASGTYNLSGTGQLNTSKLMVGFKGTGALTMTSGTLTVRDNGLFIGSRDSLSVGGGTGTVTISGGAVSVYGSIGEINCNGSGISTLVINGFTSFSYGSQIKVDNLSFGKSGYGPTFGIASGKDIEAYYLNVGDGGWATINQTGGSVHQPSAAAGHLNLGNSGSNSTYNLGGGSLTYSYQFVGVGATATLNQSSGTNTCDSYLHVGYTTKGTYHMTGGTLVGGNIYVGKGSSIGRFDWFCNPSGSITSGKLWLGSNGTLSMGYNFNVNTLAGGGYVAIDGLNNATLEVTNGATATHATGNWGIVNLRIGTAQGAGTYNLSGSGVGTVAATCTVGSGSSSGDGALNVSAGGSASVAALQLAQDGADGTVILTGGSLGVSGQTTDGAGIGIIQVDGGTFNPSGSVAVDNFKVGISAACTHTQNAQTYAVGTLTIGNGTYRLTGGALNVGSIANASGAGTLAIDAASGLNPSGSVNVDNLKVGETAFGIHTQSAQTYTVGTLTVGNGMYRLAGGTLNVGSVANGTGTGTFSINGGVLNASGNIRADYLMVGETATVVYTQTGYTNTVDSDLKLGFTPIAAGTYVLNGGTLQVNGTIIKGSGTGTLVINGGTLLASGNVTVTNLKVGDGATGSYTQSAHAFLATNDLTLGTNGGNGAYRLLQGALSAGGQIRVGADSGTGRLYWANGKSAGATIGTPALVLGAKGTLQMGYSFNMADLAGGADSIFQNPVTVTGFDLATIEVTNGATATHQTGSIAVGSLAVGSGSGAGTYTLRDSGRLTVGGGGALTVGGGGGGGRFEWFRDGGLKTPTLSLAAGATLAMGNAFNVEDLVSGALFNGSLLGLQSANLEVTNGGVATHNTGPATMNVLQVGSGSGAGTYSIRAASFSANSLMIGMTGTGTFNIDDAAAQIDIAKSLVFGSDAHFYAVPGSKITLTGSNVDNRSTDPSDLAGLSNLTLAFQPDHIVAIDRIEVACKDLGPTMSGFEDNFALNTLIVGLPGGGSSAFLMQMDLARNQGPEPEALYVHNLYVYPDATFDLAGLNVYYDGVFVGDGKVIGGEPQYVPEPSSAVLLACVAAALLVVWRWRKAAWG